jgi:hypothetical protein
VEWYTTVPWYTTWTLVQYKMSLKGGSDSNTR